MFFTLARITQSLILPPSGLLILMAIGFLIVGKKRILGVLCIASGFILLYGVCIDPVSTALIKPLESAYPPLRDTEKIDAKAIVVLGGGVRDVSWLGLEAQPGFYSLERMVKGVELYKKTHIPLMFVGGSGAPGATGPQGSDGDGSYGDEPRRSWPGHPHREQRQETPSKAPGR